MDWDDMRVFLALARAQSLGRAGQALKMDPATVGRRIARLEARLARRLFQRSHQGYALTEDGLRLLPHIEAAQAHLRAAIAPGAPGQGISGQIRLGAPDGCANYLLPQVIAQICEAHPALEVQIVALPRVFNLSRREADMAIGVSAPQAGRLDVRKITEYHLHFAATRAYLAAHPPIRNLGDLRAHRLVGYIPDMIFDSELDYLARLDLPGAQMASNSVPVQLNLLRHGAGLGVVHDFALPQAPELRRVLTDEFHLTRAFYLIRHADDRRNSRLDRFAQALTDGVAREVARLEQAVRQTENRP
ncbi:LysR family transcriptional regulator [Roseibaca sp. Y0-43]|uniref:LysR family transcriptional regulator n=1 Tax=Roseibaca sp. Y0-43 TaxID=2816854 RepID=UPI001D0C5D58|nr:LysR family transcriptional regulator [Roseibaca sp. Y0-43]MCC1482374.1 LysR family transcriptional regulator [Roseibaca sp. Y0-43]